jgi:hypothetical protein
VSDFARFVGTGNSLCERLKNGAFALRKRGATKPVGFLLAGWIAWSAKNTNLP